MDTNTKNKTRQHPPTILGIAALLGVIALSGTMDMVEGTIAVAAAVGAVLCLIVWAGARYVREGR